MVLWIIAVISMLYPIYPAHTFGFIVNNKFPFPPFKFQFHILGYYNQIYTPLNTRTYDFIPNGKVSLLLCWWNGSNFIDIFKCDARALSLYIFLIWITIALLLLAWQLIIYIKLKSDIKLFSFTKDESILHIFKINKLLFRIDKNVNVILFNDILLKYINCPSVIGVRKPLLLLPIDQWNSLNESQKEAVLIHELFHIKHNDNLKNIFLLFLQAIYWFNPLVWIGLRQLRQDLETKRDFDVTKQLNSNNKKAYANSIYQFALMNSKKYKIRPHSGMLCSSGVGLRLELIASNNKRNIFVGIILGIFIVLIFYFLFHKYHFDIIEFYKLNNY